MQVLGNARIDKFVKLSYMVLRSTAKVSLSRLEEAYKAMSPCMHEHADDDIFDSEAFSYASLRLPSCIYASDMTRSYNIFVISILRLLCFCVK